MKSASAAPTLDDVALLAAVSTATVSRCINEPEKVAVRTRDKVAAAIAQLGYTPNFAARSMAAKRTFTIGAIIPTMENAIFARGLQAFQEALDARGYTLLVSSSAYSLDAEEEQIRNLVARGADGLLVIGHDRDPAIYDYLEQQRVPVLVAWSYDENARAPSIGFDNRAAMRALGERVLALGHRDIAMISGTSAQNDRARMRIAGLCDAMAAHGLDPATLDPVEVPYGFDEGTEAFVSLMARTPRPSIVMCGNDVLAVGAVRGARQMGLRVPQDISITGFDDIELALVAEPALTTVHVPHRTMGALAAAELVAMIEEKRSGMSQRLIAEVVERASVAPVGR
ncbi:LacI family DNA-binding transcriptional regulator [uncultured Sulfitobacter sp.]|uniref:LacI family DNA-binding transcriptional regulator n=1 Tax=uncultured Sulfitobacter sp. TaxID=191468 RepID=UPI00262D89C0|nr:LacI family DNA-binding transcriptional regulator [uncultured Sulfitobacter sp.]